MSTIFTPTAFQGITDTDNFIPELWSDQVIGAYKANLVMGNLVTNFNHVGRKGDQINIPVPGRLSVADKTEGTPVVIQSDTAGTVAIALNKHKVVPMLIEDNASVKSLQSMEQFYTDDMGYQIAKQIDTDLLALYSGVQGGVEVIGGDGTTAWSAASSGNGTALTDEGVRTMMQTLDDVDVPENDRAIVIPPVTKKTLLGLPRYTEQAFIGEGGQGNSIRNGRIGSIYGMDVYVSTQCPTITYTSGTTSFRVGMLFDKSALALEMQTNVKFETQRKAEYLGDLILAHVIYGVAELRDDAAVAFVVPA
jgi:N4-gp56 family major capsid protein